MAIVFRQVCLVAKSLAPVIDDLKTVFRLNTAYIDEEVAHFGLENTLLAVGSHFIEVVAPVQPGTAAGRYLERRGGDGGYMVIGQAESKEEQQACRARAEDNAVRVAYAFERTDWHLMQLHPRDMQAGFFEVDWVDPYQPTGYWPPADGDAWQQSVNTDAVSGITGVTLQGPDPAGLAQLWARVAGSVVDTSRSVPRVALSNIAINFVPDSDGRGPGLCGVDIKATDRSGILSRAAARGLDTVGDNVVIGGVRFRLS